MAARPTFLASEIWAMPDTTVQKMIGAILAYMPASPLRFDQICSAASTAVSAVMFTMRRTVQVGVRI
jgi:hypothetical protein